jgi:ABC-2 type transport system ATP-binding protein
MQQEESLMVDVKNLTKQYKDTKEFAVDDISFSVGEGEFFAFLGPNGAGKSTTISILTTTLSKTSGEVTIDGYDLVKEVKQIRRNIGIIFQKPSLDKYLSAEQNIRFHACMYGMYMYRPFFKWMPEAYKNRVMELSEIMGIKDDLWKPIKNFSGGMQRKLEIVRSLIHTPKILFLDEPTQGLDAVSRRALWNYINQMRKENGTTVFLTTHYIDEAEDVDKVSIINHGKIIISGTPNEIKRHLIRKELILDAENRGTLEAELKQMGLDPINGNHITVSYNSATPMDILQRLQTPLTILRVNEPTLEDAYINLVEQKGIQL